MENQKYVKQILDSVNSVLVGKEDKTWQAVLTLLAGGHLLLEDVPGVGKTTLANALANSIQCDFGRIQFTPDTLPSDVLGVSIYNMKTGGFEYSEGAIMHQIILADEINRTSPKTQASLLEAMEEGQITVDGTIYPLKQPFMVIATQNPIDFLGTYNLPEAQLDRFLMKITIGYPNENQEQTLVRQHLKGVSYKKIKPVVDEAVILAMRQEVLRVKVQDELIEYVIKVVSVTRDCESLVLGASPRAAIAVVKAAQAEAYMQGREFVIPDDIRAVMFPVLSHRLVLSMEAKMNKVTPEAILKDLTRKIPIPVFHHAQTGGMV